MIGMRGKVLLQLGAHSLSRLVNSSPIGFLGR